MKQKNIMIIGATSLIAQETAKIYACELARFFLIARDEHKLISVSKNLELLGASEVRYMTSEACDFRNHPEVIRAAFKFMPLVDIVLIAHGDLGNQIKAIESYQEAEIILAVNFTSFVSYLTPIAMHFESQRAGTIAVISSVAGERGRASNYVYGSAKAGLTAFLSGLCVRMHQAGVHILTIKPGFVDTPMTKDFSKTLLWVKPSTVARDIYSAIKSQKSELYTPFYWSFIMFIIRNIPMFIFKMIRL